MDQKREDPFLMGTTEFQIITRISARIECLPGKVYIEFQANWIQDIPSEKERVDFAVFF